MPPEKATARRWQLAWTGHRSRYSMRVVLSPVAGGHPSPPRRLRRGGRGVRLHNAEVVPARSGVSSPHPPQGGSPGDSSDGDRGTEPSRRAALIARSEEHTSELQSPTNLVCRLLLEKKKQK